MSFTALAIGASALGFTVSEIMLVATWSISIDQPLPLILLFAGFFPCVLIASFLHPKGHIEGTQISVSWNDVRRSLPTWVNVLTTLTWIVMIAMVLAVPEFRAGLFKSDESDFSLGPAQLVGRLDRVRVWISCCAVAYSMAFALSVSARRLRTALALPWLPP